MGNGQRNVVDEDAEANTDESEERHQEPEEGIWRPDEEIVLGVVHEAFCGVAMLRSPLFCALRHQRLYWPSKEKCSTGEANEYCGYRSVQTLVQAL